MSSPEPERTGIVVGLVPARGGSKRIPRKNIRPFHGRPMIARTIETMTAAAMFDRIVVSTDDDEIAAIAEGAGAEAPFRRPAELADDHAGTGAVVRHAIVELERDGAPVDALCLVYPTAVFTTSADLSGAGARLLTGSLDYVFSATRYAAPIERALRRRDDGTCEMVWPEHLLTRSQDLEDAYHDVGQFYWGTGDAWRAATPVMQGVSEIFEIPPWRVQDIDTPDDWQRAELLFELLERVGPDR